MNHSLRHSFGSSPVDRGGVRKPRIPVRRPLQYPEVQPSQTIRTLLGKIVRMCFAMRDPPLSLPEKHFGSMAVSQSDLRAREKIERRFAPRHVCPPTVLEKHPIESHKLPGSGTNRFPDALLHEAFGLVRLISRTASFPWATS